MATNKTIQPTNVTVQIPAMADVPDASVFSNAIDKSIDGINAINSQIATRAKGAFQSWGSSLSATGFHHGLLLLANSGAFIVWFASTDGINIRSLRASDGSTSGTGSVSFGADDVSGGSYTITRSGTDITVSFSSGNTTMSLLYM